MNRIYRCTTARPIKKYDPGGRSIYICNFFLTILSAPPVKLRTPSAPLDLNPDASGQHSLTHIGRRTQRSAIPNDVTIGTTINRINATTITPASILPECSLTQADMYSHNRQKMRCVYVYTKLKDPRYNKSSAAGTHLDMVEVDDAAPVRNEIRKLNKRLLKLRESESQIMKIVYGGNVSYSQTLQDMRGSIADLENTIARLRILLSHLS